MADATSQKLVQLLGPKHPGELRCAAALVLGEIGCRGAELAQPLLEALDEGDPAFRAQVLTAIGKLRIERALPRLIEVVSSGGPEAELAAQAAARLGARGTKALRQVMEGASPVLRRRVAAALAAGGTASSETAAVDALLDEDPTVIDAATRSLTGKIPSLATEHRQALADHVLSLLQAGDRLSAASEAALIRLLAALGDPRGEAVFWPRVEPGNPPELRAAALQALGGLPTPSGRDKLGRLLDCAASADFRVAAPALMILKGVALSDRTWKDWLPLLEAPDPAVRRFGIDKLQAKDTAEVAAALVRQLQHPDRALREQALAALSRLEEGRTALAQQLKTAASADEAWNLARAQAPFVGQYPPALRSEIFTQAAAYLEAGDRRAEALLYLLREADARELRDRLEERALALRKKKQYATSLAYLRLLTRDPACGEAIRFEAAACALKISSHDLGVDSRAADPCLGQFAGLLHRHETPPIAYVEKAKWLEPEDLFYLGFHFAEGGRQEQEFGGKVLQLVISRSPRSKLAKDAKSKLRSHGLE